MYAYIIIYTYIFFPKYSRYYIDREVIVFYELYYNIFYVVIVCKNTKKYFKFNEQ